MKLACECVFGWHCESKSEVEYALKSIDNKKSAKLIAMQKEACKNFCYQVNDPCRRISNIINKHFIKTTG